MLLLSRFQPFAAVVVLLSLGVACVRQDASGSPRQLASNDKPSSKVISLVATTDLHGHIESLPWLGGHLANLRARRRAEGGDVLLVDAGDMFQGTLESNLGEGQAVVKAYNALGYAAAAIGNHEFDFGPVGRPHLAVGGGDPRGALKARAAEARFPFLAGNLLERKSGKESPVTWPNVKPWVIHQVAGIRVGIVGGTTVGTPRATHPLNFAGLAVEPLAEAMARGARQARQAGAAMVIVVVHAGGVCQRTDAPDDLGSCQRDEEVFELARALPPGLVDAIAAGHTHRAVAHRVAGIPIVQAHADGRAFSRIDLRIDCAAQGGHVTSAEIHQPRGLCSGSAQMLAVPSFAPDACRPLPYEGRPVSFDRTIATTLSGDVTRAASERARPVGVTVTSSVWRSRLDESPLGNLAADLMRAATPGADLAFINGGSLRSDLPVGPLTYGQLHASFPFDDGLVRLHLPASVVSRVLARNLQRSGGILSLSGLRAKARCEGRQLAVSLHRPDGQQIPADTRVEVVTVGYLANGGDGLLEPAERPTASDGRGPPPESATNMRDLFADRLSRRTGPLRGDDPALHDPGNRRFDYPGRRPVRCPR